MALTPYTVENFGGLNIADDPLQIGASGATSTQNVDLDTLGRLRTRPGREYVDSDDSATFSGDIWRVISPNVSGTGAPYVRQLATSDTKIAEYLGGTVSTATVTGSSVGFVDLLNISGSQDLVLDQTGLRVWDAAAHTLGVAIVGTPKSGYLGYVPRSSRVVIAGADTSGFHRDRVNFLDPGLSTFTSTNWVELEPGRERITGVATVGDQVVVFKETRAYVFTNEATDEDGEPVFEYYPVNLGDRIRCWGVEGNGPPGRFGVDGDSAYVVMTRGVYRLSRDNGFVPQLISGPLIPIFRNESTLSTGFDSSNTFACVTQDRVYVSANGATVTLVMEKSTGQWTVYNYAATAMAEGLAARTAYAVADGRRLARLTPSVTTDLGATIDCSYVSGMYPLSDPGRVAITQQSSVVGSGTVTMALTTDLYGTLSGSATTLGTAPATAEGWPMGDQEGTWFQHTLSWSGAASVSRLTHLVSFVKPAGVR